MKMFILVILGILAIPQAGEYLDAIQNMEVGVSLTEYEHTYESRTINQCEHGGVLLATNQDDAALCWGDDDFRVHATLIEEFMMKECENCPTTKNGNFYKGGVMDIFGFPINFIKPHIGKNGLESIEIGIWHRSEIVNYNEMRDSYDSLYSYYNDKNSGYKKIRSTPKNKIFRREFSSCDGDCGMREYNGETLDMETIAFMIGQASQKAVFRDSDQVVSIEIGVPSWKHELSDENGNYYSNLKYPQTIYTITSPKEWDKLNIGRSPSKNHMIVHVADPNDIPASMHVTPKKKKVVLY